MLIQVTSTMLRTCSRQLVITSKTQTTVYGRKPTAAIASANNFFLYLIDERSAIERPPNKEVFHPLQGISSTYQFVVNNVGLVYMRRRSCWCLQCMSKLLQSSLTCLTNSGIASLIICTYSSTLIYVRIPMYVFLRHHFWLLKCFLYQKKQ